MPSGPFVLIVPNLRENDRSKGLNQSQHKQE